MHLKQQQKPINGDKTTHLVARHLQVFGTVGKPLPISFLAGEPVHVVAARLGHADPSVTLRVYAHVIRDQADDASDVFARSIPVAEEAAVSKIR